MINIDEVQEILKKDLNFSDIDLQKLTIFNDEILKFNKKYNLIGKSTEKEVWHRHFLDCAQLVNFIDFSKDNSLADLGTGAGLPGIVLAILMKPKNPQFKVILYEKSFHKSKFLTDMSKKFNLNTEVHQKNIFEEKNLSTDVIICRAFKPMPIIFEIAERNFKSFKYIILFLGKSGKNILKQALKIWKFDYEEKKSLTSDESLVVKISNLQKKNG